jgi:hypothetical protein
VEELRERERLEAHATILQLSIENRNFQDLILAGDLLFIFISFTLFFFFLVLYLCIFRVIFFAFILFSYVLFYRGLLSLSILHTPFLSLPTLTPFTPGNYPSLTDPQNINQNHGNLKYNAVHTAHIRDQENERARTEQHVLTIQQLRSELLTNSANYFLAIEKLKLSLKVIIFLFSFYFDLFFYRHF